MVGGVYPFGQRTAKKFQRLVSSDNPLGHASLVLVLGFFVGVEFGLFALPCVGLAYP